ncbi:MAG: transporter [Halobacteriovoraceae bacterium]|nr:transporter [Halobacteriovoraceae bacterium]
MKYFFLGFISVSVLAGTLKVPIDLPSTKVLPKGVRNISFKGLAVNGSTKYSNSGESVGVGDALNTTVTYGDLISGQSDATKAATLENLIMDLGKSDDQILTETIGQVDIKASAYVPVIAYGLTSKVTLALAIPIIETSRNIIVGVNTINPNEVSELKNKIEEKSVVKAEEFVEKINSPIPSKLSEYGYDELQNYKETNLGDIKLVSKINTFENKINAITLATSVTLPTGRELDINRVADVPTGDGQIDVGVGLHYDYFLTNSITLSSLSQLTWELSDIVERRIPKNSKSSLSDDIDSVVVRDIGDSVLQQIAVSYNKNGFNAGVGYSFQYKSRDEYQGDKYQQERYDLLGKETFSRMHAAQVVLGYDTLSLFKEKKFPVPLRLLINQSWVIDGKNVVNDPLTSVDFALFF